MIPKKLRVQALSPESKRGMWLHVYTAARAEQCKRNRMYWTLTIINKVFILNRRSWTHAIPVNSDLGQVGWCNSSRMTHTPLCDVQQPVLHGTQRMRISRRSLITRSVPQDPEVSTLHCMASGDKCFYTSLYIIHGTMRILTNGERLCPNLSVSLRTRSSTSSRGHAH
jgi:hypothetical protein